MSNTKQLFQDAYSKHCSNELIKMFWNHVDQTLDLNQTIYPDNTEAINEIGLCQRIAGIPMLEEYLRGENEDSFTVENDTLYRRCKYDNKQTIRVFSLDELNHIDEEINDYLLLSKSTLMF